MLSRSRASRSFSSTSGISGLFGYVRRRSGTPRRPRASRVWSRCGWPHLLEVRHPELELRVVGARVGRVERQELAVLVDRERSATRSCPRRGTSRQAELRRRAVVALRIGVEDAAEVLARREPVLLLRAARCRDRTGTCRARLPSGSDVFLAARRPPRSPGPRASTTNESARVGVSNYGSKMSCEHREMKEPAILRRQAVGQRIAGAKPRSARASDVSA